MTNLLVNPGFETGDFTGWTLTGDPTEGIPFMVVTSAHQYRRSGNFGAQVGPVGGIGPAGAPGFLGAGFLSQTISTTAGQDYDVTFWMSNPNPGAGDPSQIVLAAVVLDGSIIPFTFTTSTPVLGQTITGGTTLLSLSGVDFVFGFKQFTATFTATAPTHFISFSFRNDAQFFGFDDGSVALASPPPPPPPPPFINVFVST